MDDDAEAQFLIRQAEEQQQFLEVFFQFFEFLTKYQLSCRWRQKNEIARAHQIRPLPRRVKRRAKRHKRGLLEKRRKKWRERQR